MLRTIFSMRLGFNNSDDPAPLLTATVSSMTNLANAYATSRCKATTLA